MLYKLDFSYYSSYYIFYSLKLRGGMFLISDDCNLLWVCLSERFLCISLMFYDVGGSEDCFFKLVLY